MGRKQVFTNSGNEFENQIMKIFLKIEESHLLSIVRRGLTMLIPIIMVGGLAHAIHYFPNAAVNYLITERFAWIGELCEMAYQATFGLFSLMLTATIAISYAMEENESLDRIIFYVVTAIASFGTQLVAADEEVLWDVLGNQGCFVAMVVGLLSSALYKKLTKIKKISLSRFTLGMDAVLSNAIQSIVPMILTIGFFLLLEAGIREISGGSDIFTLWVNLTEQLFTKLGNGFLAAFVYTVLVHVLWSLGFHGSHMMESVAVNHFAAVGENIIFSKSLFDTYVVMGGCGTTICVLIAILLFAKKKRTRSIGKIAIPTVLFNINELLNFGIPIMLNPVMAIPFICVPILALAISYGAVSFGVISPVMQEVTWTMPVLFSGYAASGSFAGVAVQLLIIVLGVAIYLPFLKLNENIYSLRMQEQIKKLTVDLQECEARGENPSFSHRMDDLGMVTRMLIQELKAAIQKKQLYLLYQPQVDGGGNFIGAEALLRWMHPDYGFIYPPLIIYLAKEGNMLPELEKNIFDSAVGAIRRVEDECGDQFKISVNITAQSLNWEIEDFISEKLKEYQVKSEHLWLEITEQDMLTNSESILKKLNQLKNDGHKFLIDDFGMGHTSLGYLQTGYFDVVKLDGSLVRDINSNPTNQKIVASVIELSKKLDITVVAEVVETKEQCALLKLLGCDWYQGYLFGKPMPLDEFIATMKNRKK